MKAAIFKGNKSITLDNKPIPIIKDGEVLLKVKSCGICGTDQHIFHGQPGSAEVTPPRILGHELAGEVVKVGEKVTTLKMGDRVSVDPNIYCGTCSYCQNGMAHLCDSLQAIGVTRDGGMAEFCVVPESNCYQIPDTMSYEEGALVEPLGCVLHGFKKLSISANSHVLIIGGGFIGQLFLQLTNRLGVERLVVSETEESKYERLQSLGATEVINPLREQAREDINNAFDIVIECVGREITMAQAVSSARKGAQVLLFGVASPEATISVSPFDIFSKELTIKGSFINPYAHREAISLLKNRMIVVEPLISHRFALDELPQIMEQYPSLRVSKGLITF